MSFNVPYLGYVIASKFIRPRAVYTPEVEDASIPPLPVLDWTKELPWHESRKWKTRPLEYIQTVIVHQTAARGQEFKDINRYHITPGNNNHVTKKGAPHICYHYGIDKDGTCYKFNDEKYITWHCKGQNAKSIGVLVNGLFRGPRGLEDFEGDEPTIAQCHNLKRLLNIIARPKNKEVVGHCEKDPQNKSACPGYTIMEHITSWRSS
jgi:N-acetyl-anhydromuramyl-L-alanine amidase AmpD